MEYLKLGRTGLDVSVIGSGTEHMRGQHRETVVSTLRQAVAHGVNYFDIIFAMPDYLDHLAAGFQGLRERVLLAAHLGSTDKGGQYFKTRTVKHCESSFLEVLRHLRTEVVAMKPFGGGKLLNKRGNLRIPKYQTGGEAFQVKIASQVTPTQCLSYVLAQRGVNVALPGVKNEAELAAALHTLEATESECDYSDLLAGFGRYVEGECTYCNHCLPCPVVIDIGQVHRLLDLAEFGLPTRLRTAYAALPVKASACTECCACTKRCPFGVEVVGRMRQAIAVFEV
jgi:predicted aldo/keto reductase-like oxidoreductase